MPQNIERIKALAWNNLVSDLTYHYILISSRSNNIWYKKIKNFKQWGRLSSRWQHIFKMSNIVDFPTSAATSVASELKLNETTYKACSCLHTAWLKSDCKMSPRLFFKALVKERLVAAAEEIFQAFESTIVKYEEEICSSKQEIERLRGLLVTSAENQKTGLLTFHHLISCVM